MAEMDQTTLADISFTSSAPAERKYPLRLRVKGRGMEEEDPLNTTVSQSPAAAVKAGKRQKVSPSKESREATKAVNAADTLLAMQME